MRVQILDEPVRQNVELFLEILHRVEQRKKQEPLPTEKVFNAWLNRKTGRLFFAEITAEAPRLKKKEWKPIQFSYTYDPKNGKIDFFISGVEGEEGAFDQGDLAPLALQVLQGTMKTFEEIGQRLKGPSALDIKIAVLSKLIISSEVPHEDRNAIIDLWHPVDRRQAESLLKDRPVGSYLFRKDPYAEVLEEQLQKQLHKKVKCFTLTYSQEDHKISDHTLIHVDGSWQIYNDDPSLQQKKYPGLQEVLSSFKSLLRHPLYRLAA